MLIPPRNPRLRNHPAGPRLTPAHALLRMATTVPLVHHAHAQPVTMRANDLFELAQQEIHLSQYEPALPIDVLCVDSSLIVERQQPGVYLAPYALTR